jgi:hypothetical protein
MSKYVRKTEDVEAAKLDVSTPITIGEVTGQGGDWVLHHADGRWSVLTDAEFTANYDLAPEPAPTGLTGDLIPPLAEVAPESVPVQ